MDGEWLVPQNNYMDHLCHFHGRLGNITLPIHGSQLGILISLATLSNSAIYSPTSVRESKSSPHTTSVFKPLPLSISPMAKLVPLLLLALFSISMVATKVSTPLQTSTIKFCLYILVSTLITNSFFFFFFLCVGHGKRSPIPSWQCKSWSVDKNVHHALGNSHLILL